MKQLETEGVWWFPHNPDEKISGVLKYDDTEGGQLRLIGGSFVGQFIRKSYVNYDYDLICGLSSDGKLVTLWQCQDSGTTFVDGGYYGQDISINTIFWGCHFESIGNIQFTKLAINYTFLEQWMNQHTFSSNLHYEKDVLSGYSLEYKHPQIPKYKFQEIEIGFYFVLSFKEQLNSSSVDQDTYVSVESENPLHFNDFQKILIYPLRNFLSLGIGRAILPNKITGWSLLTASDGSVRQCYSDIYTSHQGHDVSLPNSLIPQKMLFTYLDIEDDIEIYLSKWFDLSKKIPPVMDLYFSLFFIHSMYLHSQFLTLAQALETYHRRLYGRTYISSQEYEQVKETLNKAIPSTVNNDLKNKLKDVLKYANEFSLRKRIRAILEEVLEPYRELVNLLIDKPKDFAEDLVGLRNYLTHYSDENRAGPSEESQMQFELKEKMKLIMQLCFFAELGMPAEMVKKIMFNDKAFNAWAKRK